MAIEQSVHWRAPTVISTSFVGACAFAVAHHVYNSQLGGTAVKSDEYSIGQLQYTQQTINIIVAFTFATLFHALLVIAISAAYTQCFWHTMATAEMGTHMKTIDHLHSVLQSIWSLFRVKLWWRYPALLLLALIAWTVSIASIIAPATLTIISAPVVPALTSLMDVPRSDFRSLKFLAASQDAYLLHTLDTNSNWLNNASVYNGPSYMAERVALSVSAQGSILPIQPPAANATWSINTHGPALKCSAVNDTLLPALQHNILGGYWNGSSCQLPYVYISWTANPGQIFKDNPRDYEDMSPLPFYDPGNSSTATNWFLNRGTIGPLDWSAVGPNGYMNATSVATIYFAIMPEMKPATAGTCRDEALAFEWTNTTFIQCELHNTTYQADFNYVNGVQNITVKVQKDTPSNPVSPLVAFDVDSATNSCPTLNANFEKCTADPNVLERLSYQAIMDAFGRVFTGTVANQKHASGVTDRTNIMHSVLLDTPELAFLAQNGQMTPMTGTGKENDTTQALFTTTRQPGNLSLSDAMESLFQNITLSMLSVPQFQPSPISIFAPAKVNVTQEIYRNTYQYSAAKLWLAYGIALMATAFASIAGFVVIYMNGASFSNNFSTVLRASRAAKISEDIKERDEEGKDPLPSYLATSRVTFANREAILTGTFFRRVTDDVESGSRQISDKKDYIRVRTVPVGTNSF